MKRLAYIFMLVAVIVASYLAGSWNSRRTSGESNNQEVGPLYYYCPMHPSYKSAKPGNAPCCGMKLVPVYTGQESMALSGGSAIPPGGIQVSREKQQLIGVRTAPAENASGLRTFRLFGRVSADETHSYKIRAAVDGVVKEVFPSTVGSFVKKDQPLASYYAPDIYQAEQGYLIALGTDRYRKNLQVQVTESRLQFLGMSATQIEDLTQTQQLAETITLRSPASGFVLAREVAPDQVFQKGEELFRIVDLSRMWIFADVFENESQFLSPGASVKVSDPKSQKEFNARISNVLPQFDGITRALKVRMDVENPDFSLRPDMFVDVEFQADIPKSLTVPADAVLDSGRKRTVYVQTGNGIFEPRHVKTGWRLGDRVQILQGLNPGEQVVVSSNFLIDSESRMSSAPAQMASHNSEAKDVKDLVCGMDVSPESSATLKSQYKGETYYFCSEMCKKRFEAGPEKYMHKPTGARDISVMPMAK